MVIQLIRIWLVTSRTEIITALSLSLLVPRFTVIGWDRLSLLISMVDQSHPTALFLLEILLNHQGPIPLQALYLSFQACINNTHGFVDPYCVPVPINSTSLAEFVEFLQSLPSLFVIIGNYVYPAGQFELENAPNMYPPNISYVDQQCPYVNQPPNGPLLTAPPIPALFDPVLRRNTMNFLQNYLMTCGAHRYIPIQRLHGCLSYVSPVVRTALPNLKSLTTFLRQYPEVFHLKDGMVRLTKPRRNHRYVFPTDSTEGNNTSAEDGYCNPQEVPKVEVVISTSSEFSDSKPAILPASDFSVILILRRILRPSGSKGFHVAIVIKQLIEFPYDVQKIIGLTRFELRAFVEKYKDFFDILPNSPIDSSMSSEDTTIESKTPFKIPTSFCVRINPDASHMRSRLVDYTWCRDASGKDASRLEQHVGRVFRVAKSWGIIDLGNHVHVFFDKSIFRNVSDLQKVFQVSVALFYNLTHRRMDFLPWCVTTPILCNRTPHAICEFTRTYVIVGFISIGSSCLTSVSVESGKNWSRCASCVRFRINSPDCLYKQWSCHVCAELREHRFMCVQFSIIIVLMGLFSRCKNPQW